MQRRCSEDILERHYNPTQKRWPK